MRAENLGRAGRLHILKQRFGLGPGLLCHGYGIADWGWLS
jgi:hypothetical protein